MLVDHLARARVRREDEAPATRAGRLEQAFQALGLRVRLAVDRQDRVPRRALGRAPPRDRLEEPCRVAHHVSDDLRAAGHALAGERLARALVGAEKELRQPVGLDPVSLLRHREVAAAEARLDVRERQSQPGGRECACERGVGVAVDEHPVGPLGGQALRDRRPHQVRIGRAEVEPVAWLVEPEFLEEDLRELAIVVLAGVHDDLLETALPKGDGGRRRLDELRPVAHDRDDFHAGYTTRRPGPLAQLVEQGTLNPKVAGSIPARPIRR